MNRILLFLLGCITTRLAFVFAAYHFSPQIVYYMAFPALFIGLTFLVLYTFRLRQTGLEVNYDRIWWDPIRPIHGALYLFFAYLALTYHPLAYVPLLVDVIFGMLAFLVFHAK